jgi:hypothetical protein
VLADGLRAPTLAALVLGLAAAVSACAKPSYQLPVQSPPAVASGGSDAGTTLPDPPRPARTGLIVPGDPSSGTGQLGAHSGEIETHTGTRGTRVVPGSNDGNQ